MAATSISPKLFSTELPPAVSGISLMALGTTLTAVAVPPVLPSVVLPLWVVAPP